jgi:hypothetical protein
VFPGPPDPPDTYTPTPPNDHDSQLPEEQPALPTLPDDDTHQTPPDHDWDMDIDMDTQSELVIIKEIKILSTIIPALLSGVALGSLATMILL